MSDGVEYEYAVFYRNSDGFQIIGRPWDDEEDANDFRDALIQREAERGTGRAFTVRRRAVSGWENTDGALNEGRDSDQGSS